MEFTVNSLNQNKRPVWIEHYLFHFRLFNTFHSHTLVSQTVGEYKAEGLGCVILLKEELKDDVT